jgi:peptide/nickel transport system substrate-binding protein
VHTPSRRRLRNAAICCSVALAVLGAACGGGDDDDSGGGGESSGTPVQGGEIVYGLEAENSGGWCLPEGQLAISGIMVARAIYDTLTVPDMDGDYQPFLAESVTPSADYQQWTIKLREGITFHDGSPLTATVVKNNLDAYRGQYPARKPLLFIFVLKPITAINVVDDLTLTVDVAVPWPAFPAYLFSSGRLGIVAQAQLDDPETCDTHLIGTGPFQMYDGTEEVGEWVVNDHLTAKRNESYWWKDAEDRQLPYADSVTFRPIVDATARLNALQSGQVNAMHTSDAATVESLEAEADADTVNLVQSSDYAEVSYGMMNVSKPPFDNPLARQAVAYGLDRDLFNQVINLDLFEMASGPFGPGEMGYLKDAGFPTYDLDKAKELAKQYESESGQTFEFTLTHTNDPSTTRSAQFIQEQAAKAGVKVNLKGIEQAQLINTALGGDFQAISWRNHPGGDPDTQYIWWYGGSPVNFGRIDDPEINALLDQARSEPDKAKRVSIYEDVNREFAKEVYDLWLNWTEWNIATAPEVEGVFGPSLPTGEEPFPGLAAGHTVAGMWVEK